MQVLLLKADIASPHLSPELCRGSHDEPRGWWHPVANEEEENCGSLDACDLDTRIRCAVSPGSWILHRGTNEGFKELGNLPQGTQMVSSRSGFQVPSLCPFCPVRDGSPST